MNDKKDPNTGEKLFTLADEPNFPPYYPKIPEIETDSVCPICHDLFNDSYKMIITNCGHKFCASCFNDYIQTRQSMNSDDECICAYCKQIVSLKTMNEINEEFLNTNSTRYRNRGVRGRGGRGGRGGRF